MRQPTLFRPGHFRRSSLAGDTLPPPQATTLPATQVTATSASLNGSVNPNGLATTWWFVWGPDLHYGSSSTPVSAGFGSVPVTIELGLTELTTGSTYHFALVASSNAGQVTGYDQVFVAQDPVVPPSVSPGLQQFGPPAAIPHLEFPFKIDGSRAVVNEQGADAEIFSCVKVTAACTIGQCPELPTFGIPDMTFSGTPLSTDQVVLALKKWEPRADESAIVQMVDIDGSGQSWEIDIASILPFRTTWPSPST